MEIEGVILIKAPFATLSVGKCKLRKIRISGDLIVVWQFVMLYDDFEIGEVRRVFKYAKNLAKKHNLFFVGYRNGRVDGLSYINPESKVKGYPFYTLEFINGLNN